MSEADATNKLELGDDHRRPPTAPQPLVPGVEPGHLLPYVQTAALSFLGLLAVGALFIIALKLQSPNLGAGANFLEVLSSIMILSLAVLRVPVHVGGLTFTALPLGALVAFFFIVRWACRTGAGHAPPRRALVVGVLFALVAWLTALVFRLRFEPDELFAGSIGALVLGFVWVSLFAAAAFARRPLLHLLGERAGVIRTKRPAIFEGLRLAAAMLVALALMGTAAALIWAIVALLQGAGPQQLDVGDLAAGVIFLIAFAPNLVLVVIALALGAPVDYGAGLTLAGKVRGPLRELSIYKDVGIAVLLVIPLVACVGAGYWARRNTARRQDGLTIVAIAAVAVALVLAASAALGDVRLGAKLASARGFGLIAPRAWLMFVMATLWAAVGGYVGWLVADKRS